MDSFVKILCFVWISYLLCFSISCKRADNKKAIRNDTGNHLSRSRKFEGVWVQTYPSDYKAIRFDGKKDLSIGPGIYIKLKIQNGILKIWHLEKQMIDLEEFRKFECHFLFNI